MLLRLTPCSEIPYRPPILARRTRRTGFPACLGFCGLPRTISASPCAMACQSRSRMWPSARTPVFTRFNSTGPDKLSDLFFLSQNRASEYEQYYSRSLALLQPSDTFRALRPFRRQRVPSQRAWCVAVIGGSPILNFMRVSFTLSFRRKTRTRILQRPC